MTYVWRGNRILGIEREAGRTHRRSEAGQRRRGRGRREGSVNTTDGSGVAGRGVGLAWAGRVPGGVSEATCQVCRAGVSECSPPPASLTCLDVSLLPIVLSLFNVHKLCSFFSPVLMYFLRESLVMGLQPFCDLFISPIHSCLASIYLHPPLLLLRPPRMKALAGGGRITGGSVTLLARLTILPAKKL